CVLVDRIVVNCLSFSRSFQLLLILSVFLLFFFFFNATATTEIYTLSLHDALPIWRARRSMRRTSARSRSRRRAVAWRSQRSWLRSEEHTSELQSHLNLVCRLLLEKKKKMKIISKITKYIYSLQFVHSCDTRVIY